MDDASAVARPVQRPIHYDSDVPRRRDAGKLPPPEGDDSVPPMVRPAPPPVPRPEPGSAEFYEK
jgi:hypothetical protein